MFKEVTSHPDFVKMEKKTLKRWYGSGVVKKYLNKNKNSKKRFKFLDGPITANNPMGVHHAHGRTAKDFFQRYKNMQGFKQRFQNGFDGQGLWVEVEEEKDRGFNSKKDIEKFGIANFSRACRARVLKFSKIQTEQSKRLGMFMDWGSDYHTMSDINNEYIWYFLEKCHEKKLLYEGVDVMPWCMRCGTAISQHELSDEGWKELEHKSVYLKYPIMGRSKESLLVWTTTPWTLPSNAVIAVNPKLKYVKVNRNGEILYIAKDRFNKVLGSQYRLEKEIKGKELLGLKYEGPFDDLTVIKKVANESSNKNFHVVVDGGDLVSGLEGTGLVHMAPGTGAEDFELSKNLKIPVIEAINEKGEYLEDFDGLSGKNAAKNPDIILEDLEKRGWIYRIEKVKHRYPNCWRCKEELVFRLTKEWFIKMDPIREKLKKEAKRANWMPEFAGKRMQNWLDSMGDWPISRKRYWGLALPFWVCEKCGNVTVVGSKKDLKKHAIDPKKVDKLPELHKPWIDEIKIKCTKCKDVAARIPEVGDAWLDAGIVPYSTLKYLKDKKYWKQWFPVSLVLEYIAQVRLWFYSTLVMSVVLEGKVPWENVLATGFIVDEKGEAMHKSKGNAIDFNEASEKVGADTMRFLYLSDYTSNLRSGSLRFGYNVLDEVRKRFLLILWNSYKFFITYANLDGWRPKVSAGGGSAFGRKSKNVLDKWVVSRLNNLIMNATESLNKLDSPRAANEIKDFVINDFSTWFIRRSRDRVGPSAQDGKDKNSCHQTTFYVLETLSKLLAPFTPFISEEIYLNLTNNESVHLADWPKADKKHINRKLEDSMATIRQIVEKGRAERKAKKFPVRQPLRVIRVFGYKNIKDAGLIELIKDELNVKKVEFVESKDESVEFDTKLTQDLILEGKAREMVRSIQDLRKKAGRGLGQKIDVTYQESNENNKVVSKFGDYIKKNTLSKSLKPGTKLAISGK